MDDSMTVSMCMVFQLNFIDFHDVSNEREEKICSRLGKYATIVSLFLGVKVTTSLYNNESVPVVFS